MVVPSMNAFFQAGEAPSAARAGRSNVAAAIVAPVPFKNDLRSIIVARSSAHTLNGSSPGSITPGDLQNRMGVAANPDRRDSRPQPWLANSASLISSSSPISAGSALPPVCFMTWPRRNPLTASGFFFPL